MNIRAVNLDPFHTHSGWVKVPIHKFGIDPDQPYLGHGLIGNYKYINKMFKPGIDPKW